jgi:predicted phage terminase large subunit-like protein
LALTQSQQQLIDSLPPDKRTRLLSLAEELQASRTREAAGTDFLSFVETTWPIFISGRHHKIMADAFDRIVSGELKRLIINMPPRHTKSEFASYHLPAYYLGHHPGKKVIQASHTAELAVGFGRKTRDLIADDVYRQIFPNTHLKADSKAAGRWQTSLGGEYFAIGVGGRVTGKGADLLIIDDPHSEQEGGSADPAVFDRVEEWYTSGPRQRLQPGAAIVIVMTRWDMRDLTGRIINSAANRNAPTEWEVIEFPAILPNDKPLWPEFWPLEEILAIKEEIPNSKWLAQYQQNPTSEEGALIKREWWRLWRASHPPQCEFIIQCWDTAYLKTETADYSACTTWGVFYHPDDDGNTAPNLILLDAFRSRLEFPDLKKTAYKMWKDREPDAFMVEEKASGLPLIFELRAMGIPVQGHKVGRGSRNAPNDKVARVNAISDVFASGVVWCPETRWAEMVRDECAGFPNADHDDLVDTTVMAVMRFRHGGFVPLPSDEPEEPKYQRVKEYY